MFQQVYWDDFDIQTFLDVFGLEAEHSIEMQLLGWENGVLEWKEHGINLKQWVVGATLLNYALELCRLNGVFYLGALNDSDCHWKPTIKACSTYHLQKMPLGQKVWQKTNSFFYPWLFLPLTFGTLRLPFLALLLPGPKSCTEHEISSRLPKSQGTAQRGQPLHWCRCLWDRREVDSTCFNLDRGQL